MVPATPRPAIAHPLCRAEGIPLIGGGGTDLRAGFATALRAQPPPGRHRGPDRRADTLAERTARRAARSWVCSPARSSYDEDDPDYVPDTPPAWARVVQIG